MMTHLLPSHGSMNPWGLLVHSTGNGLAQKALQSGNIAQTAIDVYSNMKEGPAYCIAPDGTLIKFREPNTVSWHAGVSSGDRQDYLTGRWETTVDKKIVDWWKLRWPGRKSPQHLYPTKSPNECFVGVELIPCGVYQKSTWVPLMGTPATPQSRYTAEQYTRLALLYTSLSISFGWPPGITRLLGHEDIDPKDRPGYDPGSYHGWFSWSLIRGMVAALQADGTKGREQ